MKRLILLIGLIGCLPKAKAPEPPVELNIPILNEKKIEFKKIEDPLTFIQWNIGPAEYWMTSKTISPNEIMFIANPEVEHTTAFRSIDAFDDKDIYILTTTLGDALQIEGFYKEKREIRTLALCGNDDAGFSINYRNFIILINCFKVTKDEGN